MQIPILNGIYTDATADFRTSYPVNLVPVPKEQGISQGYLKTAAGLTAFVTGPGLDRGGFVWNGVHYRVSGTRLISISEAGVVTDLGEIPGAGRCVFDRSFDRLAISNGSSLFYLKDKVLTQVTDADLGVVKDHLWVDGYFMTTDGANIVVTELNDPASVNPLKYGSSEASPDPVVGLCRPVDEVYVLNRYTIEVFSNVGGSNFPFAPVSGATIPKGAVGRDAKCLFAGSIAFVGGGENEPPGVHLVTTGAALPLSTREIDIELEALSEAELSAVVLEARTYRQHQALYLHLPDKTAVYDLGASKVVGEPVWYYLSSGSALGRYRAWNFSFCYGKWICGDKEGNQIGIVDETVATQYGDEAGWQFDTALIHNEGRGAIFWELELCALTGRSPSLTKNPTVYHSYTHDGMTWSDEKPAKLGASGMTQQRVVWYGLGAMDDWRGLRFRGVTDAPVAFARLGAKLEGLYV